jgi:parallel beta-helix repeat protein
MGGLSLHGYSIEHYYHNIDKTNEVNGKTIYYYSEKNKLSDANFTDAGQIFLVNCNDSVVRNQEICNTSVGFTCCFSKNITINKLILTYGDRGFYLNSVKNSTLEGINCSFNKYGSSVKNCNESVIIACDLRDGISMSGSDNLISSNKFFDHDRCLTIGSNSNNTSIINNTFVSNYKGLFIRDSKNLILSSNNFTGCGLNLEGNKKDFFSLNISRNNLVNDKPLYFYANQKGLTRENFTLAGPPGQVILVGCNNSMTSHHKILDTSIGIQALFSNNLTFSNITTEDNDFGIESYNYSNVRVINSKFVNSTWRAVGLHRAYKNRVEDCNISSSYIGISLIEHESIWEDEVGFGENRIINNSISNNDYAIYVSGNKNKVSLITNNKIYENKNGIYIGWGGSNTSLYYNNFINNGINAIDDGENNFWSDGELGNYWDDYSGGDISPSDGIGDSSYTISGYSNSFDPNPLMYPTYEDTDNDGLKNFEEYIEGTDTYKTNVSNPDSDYDQLSDFNEWIYSTDPWDEDTDDDFMLDGWEVSNNLNPKVNDSAGDLDNDTLTNLEEYYLGTAANNNDTDEDLMPDGWEVKNGLNPRVNDSVEDLDNDTLTNLEEYFLGTAVNNSDSDFDNFSDGIEVSLGTNPLNKTQYPKPDLSISKYNCTNITLI